jgi:hypothetical protein
MKSLRTCLFAVASTLCGATACSPYSPDLSPSPFGDCSKDGNKCPENYTCKVVNATTSICEKGEPGPDAALPPDAVGQLICNNDSALEPNDATTMAYPIPPRTIGTAFKFTQVAICPASDKDLYKIVVDANATNVTVVVDFDRGPALAVSILNSSGVSVISGTVADRQNVTMFANAPAGEYFVQVTGTGNNNYDIAITQTR